MKRRLFAPLVDSVAREIRLAPEWLLASLFGSLSLGLMVVMIMAVLP